jgi:hypothetical protein
MQPDYSSEKTQRAEEEWLVVSGLYVVQPDVEVPDVVLTDVELPDVELRDVEVQDVVLTDVERRVVEVQDVELPDAVLTVVEHEPGHWKDETQFGEAKETEERLVASGLDELVLQDVGREDAAERSEDLQDFRGEMEAVQDGAGESAVDVLREAVGEHHGGRKGALGPRKDR